MASLRTLLIAICAAIATVVATPTMRSTTSSPIVTLDRGEFTGTTSDGVNKFLGIPFAQPPSVVYAGFSSLSSLTDPPNRPSPTVLATCASVYPRHLAPTLAHTTLLRSVFHAPNKHLRRRFRTDYLNRRLTSSRAPSQP